MSLKAEFAAIYRQISDDAPRVRHGQVSWRTFFYSESNPTTSAHLCHSRQFAAHPVAHPDLTSAQELAFLACAPRAAPRRSKCAPRSLFCATDTLIYTLAPKSILHFILVRFNCVSAPDFRFLLRLSPVWSRFSIIFISLILSLC